MNCKTHFYLFLLLILFCIPKTTPKSEECNDSKCYKSVNNSTKALNDLVHELQQIHKNAKYPVLLDMKPYEKLLKKYEQFNIRLTKKYEEWNKINPQLNALKTKCETDLAVLENLFEKLKNARNNSSDVNNTNQDDIRLIEEELEQKFQLLVKIDKSYRNAVNECEESGRNFENVTQVTNDLFNEYKDVNNLFEKHRKKTADLNNDLKLIFNEIKMQKAEIKHFKVPIEVNTDYIRGIEMNFINSMALLKNNSNILEDLLKGLLVKHGHNFTKDIAHLKKMLSIIENNAQQMNKSIDDYEKALSIANYNKTIINIDYVVTTLDKLESTIASNKKEVKDITNTILKQTKEVEVINLLEIDNKISSIFQERSLLLSQEELLDFFTDQKLDDIEDELNRFEERIELHQQKNNLQEEVKKLEMYYNGIKNVNCAEMRESLTVED